MRNLRTAPLCPSLVVALTTVPLSIALAGQTTAKPHSKRAVPQPAANKKASPSGGDQSSALDQQYAYIKAVSDVEALLDTDTKLQKQIGDQVNALKSAADSLEASENGLTNLHALVDLVPKLNPTDVSARLNKQIRNIDAAKLELKSKHDLLGKLTATEVDSSFSELKTALGKYSSLIQQLIEMRAALKSLGDNPAGGSSGQGDLANALSHVATQEAQMLDNIRGKLKALQNLPEQASKDDLRHALHDEVGNLKACLLLRYKADADLGKLHEALGKLAVSDKAAADSTAACDKALLDVLNKSKTWLTTLARDTLDESKQGDLSFDKVLLDPRRNNVDAQASAAYIKTVAQDLDTIDSGLKDCLVSLGQRDFPAGARPAAYVTQPFGDRLAFLEQAIQRLDIVALKLAQPYPLDMTRWDAEQINLYYFDDVPRLIQVLNDKAEIRRNDTEAAAAADKARTALNTAAQDVLVKRQAVNDLRRQIQDNTEAVRVGKSDSASRQNTSDSALWAAKARAQRSADAQRQAQLRHDEAQAAADRAKAEQDLADKRYKEAQADTNTSATMIAQLKGRRDAADQRAIDASARVEVAQAALTKTTAENTAAQSDLTAATTDDKSVTDKGNADLNDLKTALLSSVAEESKAEDSLRSATTTAYLTAQADNLSFAHARDNAPFWVSLPATDQLSSNSDPLKRVLLFGFPNSRTLFIRGSEADVALVKEMIAKFDQPQAQAEMSVYTLEISSDTTMSGIKRFQDALQAVQEELAIHRVQSDVALTLLRECINREVMHENAMSGQKSAQAGQDAMKNKRMSLSTAEDQNTMIPLSVKYYFDFYDAKVIEALNLSVFRKSASNNLLKDETVNKIVPLFLPNPSCTATLAEALVVLALASEEHRSNIVKAFVENFQERMEGQISSLPTVSAETLNNLKRTAEKEIMARKAYSATSPAIFSNFRRLFSGKTDGEAPDVCAFQNELVTELCNNSISSMLLLLRNLKSQDDFFRGKLSDIDQQIQNILKDAGTKLVNLKEIQAKSGSSSLVKEGNNLSPLSLKPPSKQDLYQAEKRQFYMMAAQLPFLTPGDREKVRKTVTNETLLPESNDITNLGDEMDKLLRARTSILNERINIVDRISIPVKYAFSHRDIDPQAVEKFAEQYITALKDQDHGVSKIVTQTQSDIKRFIRKLTANSSGQPNNIPDIPNANDIPSASLLPQVDNPLTQLGNQSLAAQIASLEGLRDFDFYERRHAQVAKLNETLKRFIRAVDEDIKGQYLNPMLRRLQNRLMAKHLGVGIFQHTSMLASNRLVARVDPQATAQVALGDEQNALQESLQLAQLVATAQTGGALGLMNGLKGLNAQPKGPAPGVYGISTGNLFQVTPIFDPTGQAMRFRFDYVAANQIQEPNGTINPQLPRIERHSINTEVQLSNYDMRLASSFNANAKLGLPTRTWGGIPVLKDIPILKEIPLIGWFTRRGGQAAVAQQSLILTQASMYPTVQDVIHLLTQSQTPAMFKDDALFPVPSVSENKNPPLSQK